MGNAKISELDFLKQSLKILDDTSPITKEELLNIYDKFSPTLSKGDPIYFKTNKDVYYYKLEDETLKFLKFVKSASNDMRVKIYVDKSFVQYLDRDFWKKQSDKLLKFIIRKVVRDAGVYKFSSSEKNFYRSLDPKYYDKIIQDKKSLIKMRKNYAAFNKKYYKWG